MKNKKILMGVGVIAVIVVLVIIFVSSNKESKNTDKTNNASTSGTGTKWVNVTTPGGEFTIKLPETYTEKITTKEEGQGIEGHTLRAFDGQSTYVAGFQRYPYQVTQVDPAVTKNQIQLAAESLTEGTLVDFEPEERNGAQCTRYTIDSKTDTVPTRTVTLSCTKNDIRFTVTSISQNGSEINPELMNTFTINE